MFTWGPSSRAGGAGDSFFGNVALLLKGDNPGDPTSFIDSSSYADNKTVDGTNYFVSSDGRYGAGSVRVSTLAAGPVWSGTKFARATNAAMTIEFWFKVTATANATAAPSWLEYKDQGGSSIFQLTKYGLTNLLNFRIFGADNFLAFTPDASGWTHAAIVLTSSTTVYVNGASAYSGAQAGAATSGSFQVGNNVSSGTSTNGLIDDLRVTAGVARYTGNFTPPGSLPTGP